jgi:ABC-2 type transport system ATP-binding protein
MTSSHAVEANNLSKSFGGGFDFRALVPWVRARGAEARRVVDDVSFRVCPGETYGIIGANGSGKSTVIRMLSTLLLPDAGEIRVFGLDAVREPTRVRRLINRVSADPSFFRTMSALENLRFFGRVYGLAPHEIEGRALAMFARLGLEAQRARAPMTELSRGQQQKVAVARCFLSEPALMLLDEPTTGLDPRSKREVQAFVRDAAQKSGATTLLTTHDMEEAELLCDRIAFLVRGQIVAEGTPLALRERVAAGRPLDQINMETVFMELTGRDIEENDRPDEEMIDE